MVFNLTAILFLCKKYGVFPFQNSFKALDPSYKTDLDLLDCFEREDPMS